MLAGASDTDASKSTFNDVRQNQYNVGHVQLVSPCLAGASSVANFISSLVPVQASREQIRALSNSIDTLLKALDTEYFVGRLLEAHTSVALKNLSNLLKEIAEFVQKQISDGFLKLLFMKGDCIVQIETYYH